jgi:glycyl-tRNA synthetase beta chain
MTTQNLLVELFVEELPPKALKKLGESFAGVLAGAAQGPGPDLGRFGGHRLCVAAPAGRAHHHVWRKAADKAVQQKLMPVAVGLDADGQATPALLKKLQALGADVSDPAAAVAASSAHPTARPRRCSTTAWCTGATLADGLQKALDEAIAKLPIPKVMSYQLETDCELPGWSSVNFVRPAHGLVALHGSTVVPVKALGLRPATPRRATASRPRLSPVVMPTPTATPTRWRATAR